MSVTSDGGFNRAAGVSRIGGIATRAGLKSSGTAIVAGYSGVWGRTTLLDDVSSIHRIGTIPSSVHRGPGSQWKQ